MSMTVANRRLAYVLLGVLAAIGILLALLGAFFPPFQTDREVIGSFASSGNLPRLQELVTSPDEADVAMSSSVSSTCSADVVQFALAEGANPARDYGFTRPSAEYGVVVEGPLHSALLNPSCSTQVLAILFRAAEESCERILSMEPNGTLADRLVECQR